MDIVIQVLVALISTLKSCLLMTKFYHSYFSPPILGGITPLFDYSLMLIWKITRLELNNKLCQWMG